VGEIKSTLELAMEKTKKFAISETEREEMKKKEVMEKATRLFHQYLEGYLPLNDILKQIERMEKKTAATVKEFLLSQWIDALSLDGEEERILKGVESLGQRNIDEVKQKLRRLVSQYREEKEKVEEKVKTQWREVLKKEGIYGSAVEPKLEGDELWKKENEKLDHSYKMALDEIKERLRGL
jgi:Na+/phosphate symporter